MKQNIDESQQKAAEEYIELPDSCLEYSDNGWEDKTDCDYVEKAFIAGAKWQKEHLWKSADGEDLPKVGREVVVFTQNFPDDAGIMKVGVAYRPDPKEHYIPKTYGNGGWNIPDVVMWLDLDIPNLEEYSF